MKTRIWSLFLSLSFLANGSSAFAESNRVQETLDQSAQSLAEQIHQKKQQVTDAEEAIYELKAQMALAREKKDSNGTFKIKKVFIVTAVISLGVFLTNIVRENGGIGPFILSVYGVFGMLASGAGYAITDYIEIKSSMDKIINADLDQAQLELSALKRSLARLEAKK